MKKGSALILAAGKGVRMKSSLAKVMHPVGGVPLVERVLATMERLGLDHVGVVVGHKGPEVSAHLKTTYPRAKIVHQRRLDGSGGALRQARRFLNPLRGDLVVTCGDTPFLRVESLKDLLRHHRRGKNVATVLTAQAPHPFGYGRIVRAVDGSLQRIVEELDASPREKNIVEINTGTYCFDVRALRSVLPKLSHHNVKREYYLTDTLQLLREKGGRIGAVICREPEEALGVNRRADLAVGERVLRFRVLKKLMDGGVTVIDPESTYIGEEVKIAPDTVIYPQTFIQGETKIGAGCQIGPWAHIVDCVVENGVIFQASFAQDSLIRRFAKVGPYSRVRPHSRVGVGAHLGNFSEIKNASLGAGTKVNHLSYLGDSILGKNVNIGAGTITCNYDGLRKFTTTIEDQAFIGSNVNLIAPIRVGKRAVVGAGSSLNHDVPAGSLAFERAPARIVKGWGREKLKRTFKK